MVLALTISSALLIPPIAGAIGGQAKAANRLKLEAARDTSFTRAKHIGLAVILYVAGEMVFRGTLDVINVASI